MKAVCAIVIMALLSGCVARTAVKTTVGAGKVVTKTTVGAGKVVVKGGRAVVGGGGD